MNSLVNHLNTYPYFNNLDVGSVAARVLVCIPILNVAFARLKELHFTAELNSLREKSLIVRFGKPYPPVTNGLSNVATTIQQFENLTNQKRKTHELIDTAKEVMGAAEVVLMFCIPFSPLVGFNLGASARVISYLAGVGCLVMTEKALEECEDSIHNASWVLHRISNRIKNPHPAITRLKSPANID